MFSVDKLKEIYSSIAKDQKAVVDAMKNVDAVVHELSQAKYSVEVGRFKAKDFADGSVLPSFKKDTGSFPAKLLRRAFGKGSSARPRVLMPLRNAKIVEDVNPAIKIKKRSGASKAASLSKTRFNQRVASVVGKDQFSTVAPAVSAAAIRKGFEPGVKLGGGNGFASGVVSGKRGPFSGRVAPAKFSDASSVGGRGGF